MCFDESVVANTQVLAQTTDSVGVSCYIFYRNILFIEFYREPVYGINGFTIDFSGYELYDTIFYNIYGEAVYVLENPEASDSVPDPGYILSARQVRVAYRVGGVAGVSEGLKAGDQVVTSGQLKLFPSLKVAIVDDVAEYQATTPAVQ